MIGRRRGYTVERQYTIQQQSVVSGCSMLHLGSHLGMKKKTKREKHTDACKSLPASSFVCIHHKHDSPAASSLKSTWRIYCFINPAFSALSRTTKLSANRACCQLILSFEQHQEPQWGSLGSLMHVFCQSVCCYTCSGVIQRSPFRSMPADQMKGCDGC